jgi:hypothetical protein
MNEYNPTELAEFEDYLEDKETEQNILLKIWTQPRRCFRFINEKQYDKYFWILMILAGISNAFDRAIQRSSGDTQSLGEIIIYSVLGGAIFGWLSFYIFGGILSLVGKMFNGKGNTKSITRILAYANIPAITAMLLLIPQIVVSGAEVFKKNGVVYETLAGNIAYLAVAVLELTLAGWTIVLCVIGLAEVQKFPVWKAALNLFIPLLVIFGLLLLVIL